MKKTILISIHSAPAGTDSVYDSCHILQAGFQSTVPLRALTFKGTSLQNSK
ncbi:hypothetical protein CLOSTMETH_02495, partial [[Clostridium] methylpentosum DSM 5476]